MTLLSKLTHKARKREKIDFFCWRVGKKKAHEEGHVVEIAISLDTGNSKESKVVEN